MNKIITWVIGVVAILALVISVGNAVGGSNQSVPAPKLGGTTNYDALTLDNGDLTISHGKIVQSGPLSTTTPASMTLAPSDLAYPVVLMNPTVASVTITLPATTTSGMSSFLPNAGDRTDVTIVNSTTTAGINITLAGNTGMILTNASTSKVLIGGGNQGIGTLQLIRKSNTDIGVQLVNSI